jgi:hypothetical protein
MAELRRNNAELRSVFSESYGNSKRRKEKQASAKLRGRNQNRKGFDDQSNVDKIYRWIKNVTKTKPIYDEDTRRWRNARNSGNK